MSWMFSELASHKMHSRERFLTACTYFGHRDCLETIKPKLREVLIDLIINRGVDMFYVGHQGQFDAYVHSELKKLKQKSRTKEQEKDLGAQVMELFAKLGKMRPCEPDSKVAQNWAKELQAFFTEHFYTCTPQILKSLAESYAGGDQVDGKEHQVYAERSGRLGSIRRSLR